MSSLRVRDPKPQIIKMSINTYEGSESWKSVDALVLTPEQEEKIAAIWEDASKRIKDIVFQRNGNEISNQSGSSGSSQDLVAN